MPDSHKTIDIVSDDEIPLSPVYVPAHASRRMKKDRSTKEIDESKIEPWRMRDLYRFPIPRKGDPWVKCFRKVEDYDTRLFDGWRGEVENLLIFAGLFSATITSFVLESYQQLLGQTSNSTTQNAAPFTARGFPPSTTDIRVNIFWFMSLSLSLVTVFILLLCMQWLREYQHKLPRDPWQAMSQRQIRYEGLKAWRVPDMLKSLPILLHSSLVLFFAGIVDLLWSINHIVAWPVSVVLGLVILLLLATTLLPTIQYHFFNNRLRNIPECPYKSPQARAIHRLTKLPRRLIMLLADMLPNRKESMDPSLDDWQLDVVELRDDPDHEDPDDVHVVRCLVWIDKNLVHTVDMAFAMYHCLKDLASYNSTKALCKMDKKIAQHLLSTDMVNYFQSVTEEERREINATLFLEIHRRAFPQLRQYWLESVVRLLNARFERNYAETVSIQDTFPFNRWPLHHIQGLPRELVTQFLLCTKKLLSQGHVGSDHEGEIWRLIRLILSVRDNHSPPTLQVKLAFDIMEAFEKNLSLLRRVDTRNYPGINDKVLELVKKSDVTECAVNIINALTPPEKLRGLEASAKPILLAIRKRLEKLGEPEEILEPRDALRWIEIMQGIDSDIGSQNSVTTKVEF